MTLSKIKILEQPLKKYMGEYARKIDWEFLHPNNNGPWYLRDKLDRIRVKVILTSVNKEDPDPWQSLEHVLEITASLYNKNKTKKTWEQVPRGQTRVPVLNNFKVNDFLLTKSLEGAVNACNEYYSRI